MKLKVINIIKKLELQFNLYIIAFWKELKIVEC